MRNARRDFLGAAVALGGAMTLRGMAAAQEMSGDPVTQLATQAVRETSGLRLGLASYTTRVFDLDETIRICKRAGLKHLCLKSFHLPLDATDEQCAAVAKKVADSGLDLYGGGVISMNSPAEIDRAFRYAKAAGMRVIVAAPKNDDSLLGRINERIVETGIVVAIHNHGPGDGQFPTPGSVFEKVEKYDPRFGLCIDIGHTVRYGNDLIEAIRKCESRIHDFHFKDVTEATAKGETCICGRGCIPFQMVVRTLLDIGYTGIAAFEYEAEEKDPLPGLAESVGYVRGIEAGLEKHYYDLVSPIHADRR